MAGFYRDDPVDQIDIVIKDDVLSRLHARIEYRNRRFPARQSRREYHSPATVLREDWST